MKIEQKKASGITLVEAAFRHVNKSEYDELPLDEVIKIILAEIVSHLEY